MTAPAEDGLWRRLSPKMLLVHPVREIIQFLPVLVGAVFFGHSTGSGHWWGLAATGLAVALGVLRWYTTRFRITTEQIEVRSGLFNKTSVTAPMDRVRSVDVTATILHRALGLATVKIGTGAGDKELKLDGLTAAESDGLRAELLHRGQSAEVGHQLASAEQLESVDSVESADANATQARPADEVLCELDNSWVRYAPFSPSGLLAALAAVGVASQVISNLIGNLGKDGAAADALSALGKLGVVAAVILAVGIFVVFAVVVALIGYVFSFFNYRLSYHRDGKTFHVTRGLMTTRAVSLEARRMRGVEVHQPVPLRWVRGARLSAITTGLKAHERDASLNTLLVPPAPVSVVREVADRVLATGALAETMLTGHGPAATKRRFNRAITPTVVLALAAVAGIWYADQRWLPLWLSGFGVVAVVVMVFVGRDRARGLGHAVTDRFLISRYGSLHRRLDIVELDGAVGVLVRQSIFQRRAGVSSVGLATAAGSQLYHVVDVDDAGAAGLAEAILPDVARQFMRVD